MRAALRRCLVLLALIGLAASSCSSDVSIAPSERPQPTAAQAEPTRSPAPSPDPAPTALPQVDADTDASPGTSDPADAAGTDEGACPAYEGVTCDGYVTDAAAVLADREALEDAAAALVARYGHEVAVVLVDNAPGGTEAFAKGVGDTWVVQDRDGLAGGVVVVVDPADRRLEITAGPSLQAVIPSIDLLIDLVAADFSGGDYDAGVQKILRELGTAFEVQVRAAAPFPGDRPEDTAIPDEWVTEPFATDPDLREGELDNGLRYQVLRNTRPGSQAQLWLVVRAGSLNESAGTNGVAHFLEHMMFNGTERFPGNEIISVLEGFGSSFGPDVNAYTSFEETVYKLQVPSRSADTLQLGLEVLREWATSATLGEADVVAERGVVREEHRLSVESLNGRIGRQIREVLFAETPYLRNEPIGDSDVIEAMSPAELRQFYDDWYRPELMTVLAVGDFDPGDIERRIQSTFASLVSETPTEPLVRPAGSPLPEPVYDVITDAEIQRPEIEVLWRLPSSLPLNRASVRDEYIARLALQILNERLFARVQRGEGVLLSANAGTGGFTTSNRLVNMTGRAPAEDIDTALRELLTEIEQARQFGFTEDELRRALESTRSGIDQAYGERDTRQDGNLADLMVDYALERAPLLDPETDRAMNLEVLATVRADDLQAFLFDVLATNPYVLLTAPADDVDVLPEPEELAAIYGSLVGFAVEDVDREQSAIDELMARPEPVAVVERSSFPTLRAEMVTYENGARLIFRETSITDNVVVLRGTSPGGFFAVDGPEVPLLGNTASMVDSSGFESIDLVSLDRLLTGEIVSIGTSIGRAEDSVSGDSSTASLETMLQLVHLQMSEPGLDDLQVRNFVEGWRPIAESPDGVPSIAASLELWNLRYGDSPWFRRIPTVEDLDTLDPVLLLDAYRERFSNAADFTFAVVGDFDRDELVDLGARYLGTLPATGEADAVIDRDPGVPQDNLVSTVSAGIGDQGQVRINWEAPFPFTLEAEVAAEAVELVVDARLRDLVREQLGASYSPTADITIVREPKPWVDTIIDIESDPDRVDEVSDAIRTELANIRAGEFEARYLDNAIDQLVEDYRFFSNNDWIDLMLFHARYEDRPESEYSRRSDIVRTLTVADIAEMTNVIFPEGTSVEVRLIPAADN